MLFILGDLAQEIIIRFPKETLLQYNYQMFISFCSCLKKKKKGIVLGIVVPWNV